MSKTNIIRLVSGDLLKLPNTADSTSDVNLETDGCWESTCFMVTARAATWVSRDLHVPSRTGHMSSDAPKHSGALLFAKSTWFGNFLCSMSLPGVVMISQFHLLELRVPAGHC